MSIWRFQALVSTSEYELHWIPPLLKLEMRMVFDAFVVRSSRVPPKGVEGVLSFPWMRTVGVCDVLGWKNECTGDSVGGFLVGV